MKRVVVLGSTGSVGRNTLEVIAAHPERLQLLGVATHARVDLLAEQVRRFAPPLVGVWEEAAAERFERSGASTQVLRGLEGLVELATHPKADIVVMAMSGSDGLVPLIRSIQAGKQIALASKELLVMAGELMTRLVQEHGTTLIPVDSEHAALFQCLRGVDQRHIAQLTITGSGGPLWNVPTDQWPSLTKAQVLTHPKWQMGPKITVDSATLMNKGLELIEAQWLFHVSLERVRVVIHPEAIVHAIVTLVDGTMIAQMSACDMRLPIQAALSFPERWGGRPLPTLDLTQMPPMRFVQPDLRRFPCLQIAMDAARLGGTACVVLTVANEVAVNAYLNEQLPLTELSHVVSEALEQHHAISHPTLQDILEVASTSRAIAQELVHQWSLR